MGNNITTVTAYVSQGGNDSTGEIYISPEFPLDAYNPPKIFLTLDAAYEALRVKGYLNNKLYIAYICLYPWDALKEIDDPNYKGPFVANLESYQGVKFGVTTVIFSGVIKRSWAGSFSSIFFNKNTSLNNCEFENIVFAKNNNNIITCNGKCIAINCAFIYDNLIQGIQLIDRVTTAGPAIKAQTNNLLKTKVGMKKLNINKQINEKADIFFINNGNLQIYGMQLSTPLIDNINTNKFFVENHSLLNCSIDLTVSENDLTIFHNIGETLTIINSDHSNNTISNIFSSGNFSFGKFTNPTENTSLKMENTSFFLGLFSDEQQLLYQVIGNVKSDDIISINQSTISVVGTEIKPIFINTTNYSLIASTIENIIVPETLSDMGNFIKTTNPNNCLNCPDLNYVQDNNQISSTQTIYIPKNINNDYIVMVDEGSTIYALNAENKNIRFTLPSDINNGSYIIIKKIDNSDNLITILAGNNTTIEGRRKLILNKCKKSCFFPCVTLWFFNGVFYIVNII